MREPAFNWLISSHDLAAFTKKRFTKEEIEESIKKNSFNILKITYLNFFLFPLVLVKRIPEVIGIKAKQPKSDFKKTNIILNDILFSFFILESILLKFINFPIGSTVCCVAQKIND